MELLGILIVLAVAAYFLLRRKSGERQQGFTDYLPETFVVVDLETTGLDATRHEIIEIAAIRYRKGQTTHDTIQTLVRPRMKIPKKITDLTGITPEMVEADGIPLPEATRDFLAFVKNDRLVTFNAEFDMAFLHAAVAQCDLPTISNPVSCALLMARRAWPKRKRFSLRQLASDGQIASGQGHRALEDARCALIVYAAAVAELRTVA